MLGHSGLNLEMKRTQARGLILVAVFLSLTFFFLPKFVIAGQTTSDDNLPSYVRESVGLGRSIDPSNGANTGAYSYQIPFKIPPGRGGMTPDVSLSYSSQNHSDADFLGYGWQLSIPYIQRFNKQGFTSTYSTTSPSTSFYSSLSGELATTSTSGQYYARNDNGDFLKYVFNSNVWTVSDKAGKTYLFGTSTAGRQDNPNDSSAIYKWLLQQIQDPNGNTTTYTYSKDLGQIYPQSITYTSNGTNTPVFSIDFTKALRATSTASTTETGFTVKTRYKITQISAKFNGNTVHKYDFAFSSGDNMSRQLLSSVTETGQVEASSTTISLSPTTFSYSASLPTWATSTWSQPVHNSIVNGDWDRGVDLVDVNGDGLADEVQSHKDWDGSDHYYQNVFLNTGSGWSLSSGWTVPCLLTYFVSNSSNTLYDGGGRIADLNGDQLPDFVCTSTAYLNTGSTWTASSTWNIPVSTLYNGTYDNGVRFGDVNGDGLVDILQSFDDINPITGTHTYTQRIYTNTGSGWATTTAWQIPSTSILFSTSAHTLGPWAQAADVNGDGLVDLINSSTVYINNGAGWSVDSSWATPVLVGTMTSRLVDINGDGLSDLLDSDAYIGPYPNPPDRHWSSNAVYLNTGSGWVRDYSRTIPVPFRQSTQDTGVRFGDINGDGINDMVAFSGGQPPNPPNPPIDYAWSLDNQWVSQTNPPDLLTRILEQSGSSLAVTYQQSPQYRDGSNNLLSPSRSSSVTTVRSIAKYDGLSATTTDTYEYRNGSFYFGSPFDRKFAGFNTIVKTDSEGNVTNTYYHQGNDNNATSSEPQDDQAKIGRSYRTEIYDAASHLYSLATNLMNVFVRTGVANFIQMASTTKQVYDGNSSHRDTAAEYFYSSTTGNPTRATDFGEVSASSDGSYVDTGSDTRFTDITYAASSTSMLTLPATTTVTNQSGTKISEMRNYYDGLGIGLATKGNRTKEERWKTGNTYVNTQYAYNSFGMVSSTTDPRLKTTNFTFDTYNLYVATTTNPLIQALATGYDYSSGALIQSTDANGLTTQTVLDALDRPLQLKQPDLLTPSTLVIRTAYIYTDSGMPRKTQRTDYLNSATSTDTYTYVDGFGRKVEQRVESSGLNSFTVKNWKYDQRGLLAQESLPYFASSSPYIGLASVPSNLLLTYTYDPLQRLTAQSNVIGTVTSVYDDWKTTTTDLNGHVKDYTKDAFGNLASVVEHVGTSLATTNYTYDAANNLLSITDSASNVRTFTYDGLSRLINAQDLHASADSSFGSTTWTYDDGGNVTQQLDAKNQTVNYTYDGLSRVLTEDYTGQAGTETTFGYDNCLLGKGRLCYVVASNASTTNEYNPLGLLSKERKTIASTTYATLYEYDRLGNLASTTLPDNSQIQYVYNDAGLLDKVHVRQSGKSLQSVISHLDYAPNGKVKFKAFGNGVTSVYTFDPGSLYRLTHIYTYASGTDSSNGMGFLMSGGGEEELSLLLEGLSFDDSDMVAPFIEESVNDSLFASTTPIATSTISLTPETIVSTTTERGLGIGNDETAASTTPIVVGTTTAQIAPVAEKVAFPIATTSGIALLSPDAAALKLKAPAERILGRNPHPDGTITYAYRSDVRVEELPIGSEMTAEAARKGLTIKNEVVSDRTSHSRTFATDKPGYFVTEFISGAPQYYQDDVGNWWLAEYATTTQESFDYQNQPKSDLLSIAKRIFTRVMAFVIPRVFAQTSGTFYPDGNPENTSMDGWVYLDAFESWSNTHDWPDCNWRNSTGLGNQAMDQIGNGNGPAAYGIRRAMLLFDTSTLPDSAVIGSGEVDLYVENFIAPGTEKRIFLASSTPASNTAIDYEDYDQVGNTSFGETDGSYTINTYEPLTLNASGRAAVSTSGVTKFSVRTYNDLYNVTPTNSTELNVDFKSAEQSGTSQDPKLIITYYVSPTAPTALLTNSQTNPTNIGTPAPKFSAVFNDIDASDTAAYYQVIVSTTSTFSTFVWDSGKATTTATTTSGLRVPDITYAGTALASSTTYYWRIRFWDNHNIQGDWSTVTSTFSLAATGSSTQPFVSTIQNIYIAYDNVGNISQINDYSSTGAAKTVVYTYDSLDRMTLASTTGASTTPYTQAFTYNNIGNLLSKGGTGNYTYAGTGYANPHAPTTIGSNNLTYDNNGNVLTYSPWTYVWDYRNRLTSAGNGTATTTYAYDYTTDRVKKVAGGVTSIYPNKYWYTDIGNSSTTQIYANGEVVASLVTATSTGATSTVHYIHNDWLGGLNVTTDASGMVQEATDYYPYGSIHMDTKSGTFNEGRKYIGQYYDGYTQLNYLNARYQDGARGQFLTEDPVFWSGKQNLADPQSLNSYSYANNNPISNSDPSGLATVAGSVKETVKSSANLIRNYAYFLAGIISDPNGTATSIANSGKSVADRLRTAIQNPRSAANNAYNSAAQTVTQFVNGTDAQQDEAIGAVGAFAAGFLLPGGKVSGESNVIAGSRSMLSKSAADALERYEANGWQKLQDRAAPTTHMNREGNLPIQNSGYYTEYYAGPRSGPERFVRGQQGELYYTNTHYGQGGSPAFINIPSK